MSSEARTVNAYNTAEIAEWCGGRVINQHDAVDYSALPSGINVPVGEDVRRAQVGDTIIRHHDGSFSIEKASK